MQKLIIAVVVATTFITACGSSAKSTGSSSANGSTTSVGNTGASDFSDLVNKAKDANYKVTYDTNGKTVTVAQDGNGKKAITADGGISISDGKTTITCNGTTSTATCRDFGAAGTTTFDALMGFVNSVYSVLQRVPTSASVGHTSSDTIAGREATCITVKASDVAGGIIGKATGDPSVTSCV